MAGLTKLDRVIAKRRRTCEHCGDTTYWTPGSAPDPCPCRDSNATPMYPGMTDEEVSARYAREADADAEFKALFPDLARPAWDRIKKEEPNV